AVVLFRRGPSLLETEIVLVREFRSPARTPGGFVTDLPGGSSPDERQDSASVALNEVRQELGLSINPGAIRRHCARQLVGTFATHQAEVFSAELSHKAIEEIRTVEFAEGQYGVTTDTEQTYPCIRTVQEMLADPGVDWSTLGMVLAVLENRL